MPATTKDLTIRKGETFEQVFRWETEPFIVKPITAITRGVSVRITAPGHGLVNGWRVAVVSAQGLTVLNARNNPPADDEDFRRATVIDADTIEFNGLSTADEKKPYTSGGALVYFTPHDLAGYTARMSIKDKPGGTLVIPQLTTDANGGIVIDDSAKTIGVTISATQAAAIAKKAGVYDLELESPTGVVTAIFAGSITFTNEVTT